MEQKGVSAPEKRKRGFLIDISYACFGICTFSGIVTEAAPIAKWMIGKSLAEIKPWIKEKSVKVIELDCRILNESLPPNSKPHY